MRVVVTGGRDFNNGAGLRAVLDCAGITELAAGDATGADSLAHTWAEHKGIPHQRFVADWGTHGKAAGMIRNVRMLQEFRPDCVIAFAGGRGTAGCVREAKRRGIPVYEFPDVGKD